MIDKITLFSESLDESRDFDASHASRLLSLDNGGGWSLPKNSPYTFVNGSFRTSSNQRNTAKAPEESVNKDSDSSTGSSEVSHGDEL